MGGFIASVDSLVALEALVGYSYYNNIKDLTEMQVTVDLPDSNIVETFSIGKKGITNAQV